MDELRTQGDALRRRPSSHLEEAHLNRADDTPSGNILFISLLVTGCFIAIAAITPSVANAQMESVKTSMADLKGRTATLGAPKIEGSDPVAGKNVPALYFG